MFGPRHAMGSGHASAGICLVSNDEFGDEADWAFTDLRRIDADGSFVELPTALGVANVLSNVAAF
jgi:hypothetical protein